MPSRVLDERACVLSNPHPHPQQEFSIAYEYEVPVVPMLGGKKLMSEDLSDVTPRMANSSISLENNGHDGAVGRRRRLGGFKASFSVSYKTETTDTTANTFTTKTSDFTTSTFLVNCQCPNGPLDQYCLFENSYASQVSWSSARWTGESLVLA